MTHKTWVIICAAVVLAFTLLACNPEPTAKPPTPEATTAPDTSDEVPLVSSSSGGMVQKLSIEDLTLKAGRILVGTVVDLRSEWNSDQTLIYTYATIAVEDHLKGTPDQMEVTVMVPGGQVGDTGISVSGVAEFSEGEKVLLFLEEGESGAFGVLGGFQGKLVIYGDKVFVEGEEVPLADLVNEIQKTLTGGKSQ
jgi:hypothetical protein